MKTFASIAVSLLALSTAVSAVAQQYIIDQPIGGDTFGARSGGQTITPSVGITPDPGPVGVLPLTQLTMYRGNLGANVPSPTTYINVYLGDPNNGGAFLGSSTNSVDTTALTTYHDPMVWSFPQIPMIYSMEHWLVMSSTPGTLTVVEVSLETAPRATDPYAGGTGLIANLVQHPNGVDARFEAVFFNGVLGSFTVSGAGCPSSAGLATLSATGVPTVGQTLPIDITGVAPVALTYLALGFSDTSWNGIPLPLSLSTLIPGLSPACQLLISPDASVPMTTAGSTASLGLAIPAQPGLAGVQLFVQGAQIEPVGISVTAKAAIIVGS